MPIKFAEKSLNKHQKQVITGSGVCCTVIGIPTFKAKKAKRPWRILLDSGSDGDILFNHRGRKEYIPSKERFAPQKWRTSNGTFKTTKVAKLELSFPEYSTNKLFKVRPDIVDILETCTKPVYNMIIGIETMSEMGVKLDFSSKEITIDQISLPMKDLKAYSDSKALNELMKSHVEPSSTQEATKRVVEILDAKYEKANLAQVVHDHCGHLSSQQQSKLLRLLVEHEELFDGTLGDFKTDPVSLRLKPGATPYHGRSYPVARAHKEVFRKEVNRLEDLGVLKRQPASEWASPSFPIPKKNKTVRFLTDFREVNKHIIRTPFPIPKISSVLQEMEGFSYATALDLNMGYYTIRLDPDAQRICTIILPWGKYSYMQLPIGISGSLDFFRRKCLTL